MSLKNAGAIKTEFRVNRNKDFDLGFSSAFFIDKNKLDGLLIAPPNLQGHTFKEFLDEKKLELEDLQGSKISFLLQEGKPQEKPKLLLALGKKDEKSIIKVLPLDLNKGKDFGFFNRLRQLNVGHLEVDIENSNQLQTQFGGI